MKRRDTKLPLAVDRALTAAARAYHRRLWWRATGEFGLALIVVCGLAWATRFVPALMSQRELVLEIAAGLLVFAAVAILVRVWRGRVSAHDIALHLDTANPELQNRLITAYEIAGTEDSPPASQWMIDELDRETAKAIRKASPAAAFPMSATRRVFSMAMLLAGVVVAAGFVWQLFMVPIAPVELANQGPQLNMVPVPFSVEPGDTRVRSGASQVVLVKQVEESADVALRWRAENGAWQSAAMPMGSAESVHYYQIDGIIEPLEYEVQVGSRRSERFNIAVWTPPEVETVNLGYTYPEYLGMDPKEVPNGGDISAVEGTEVRVEVEVNKPLDQAEIVLGSGDRIALAMDSERTWAATITLAEDDRYSIALVDEDGEENDYSPTYRIAALPDNAPEITIDFPTGDSEATLLEEIPFSFKVEDDFGLQDFGLQYELVGEEPVRMALVETESGTLEASADTMLMLEDLALATGDFITWTIYAEDGKPDRSEFERLGDPFFLEIRPFLQRFSEAVSDQGGMGAAGEEAEDQKQIIIATYNLLRYHEELDEEEFDDDREVILTSQRGILEQAGETAGTEDGDKLIEYVEDAIAHLAAADLENVGTELRQAIGAQNNAYRQILRMKPTESQIQQQQSQGGGGGGGQSPDISSLETERKKNFFEEATTLEQQQEATSEAQDKLRELAKRQAHINEQLAKLLSELQTASPEEQEELRRQLERLEEEQQKNMEQLDQLAGEVASGAMDREQAQDAQEDMDRARRQMDRTLRNMEEEDLQRARSSGNKARSILDDLEEHLGQLSGEAAKERLNELAEQLREMENQSAELAERTREAERTSEAPGLDGLKESEAEVESIRQDREQLAEELIDLLQDASETSRRSRSSQKLMSEKLNDWIRDTERKGIVEDINEGDPWLDYGMFDPAVRNAESIEKKLGEAADALGEVGEYLREDDLDGMQKALQELEQLLEEAQARGEGQEPGADGESPEAEQAAAGSEPGEDGQAPGEEGEGERMARSGEPNPDGEGQGPGDEPGEESGPGQGTEPGDEPGEGQSPGESDHPGMQPGEGEGEGEGQGESEQQGEGEGQGQGQGQGEGEGEGQMRVAQGGQPGQQGNQPGQQQGQQGQSGQGQGQGEPGDPSQQGQPNEQMGQGNSGGQAGGPRSGNGFGGVGPWSEDSMREFMEEDYKEWMDRLRNAESLLPEESPFREDISRMMENIDRMRRQYKREWLTPQFDLFLEQAGEPLVQTASELAQVIEKILKEQEYAILDEGAVPAEYTERVAEYFRNLAEREATPTP